MALEQVVRTAQDQARLLHLVNNLDLRKPRKVIIKEHRDNRSLSQNALYWMWLTKLADEFTRRGRETTQDEMHLLMKHKYLGYQDVWIGNTCIQGQLKSTTELDTWEMHHYMNQIDGWAADHGVLLPHPEDSEYEQLARRAEGRASA